MSKVYWDIQLALSWRLYVTMGACIEYTIGIIIMLYVTITLYSIAGNKTAGILGCDFIGPGLQ